MTRSNVNVFQLHFADEGFSLIGNDDSSASGSASDAEGSGPTAPPPQPASRPGGARPVRPAPKPAGNDEEEEEPKETHAERFRNWFLDFD